MEIKIRKENPKKNNFYRKYGMNALDLNIPK